MNKFSLKEYIELLKDEDLLVKTEGCEDVLDREVNLLSYNSKEVEKDTLFVAKGVSFKEEYLKEAIENGVFAYISEKEYDVDCPCILVTDIRRALSCTI